MVRKKMVNELGKIFYLMPSLATNPKINELSIFIDLTTI